MNHWITLRIGPFKDKKTAIEVGKKIGSSLSDIAKVQVDVVKVKNN